MAADHSEAGRSKDLVVFEILRDSKCTDCGEVIGKVSSSSWMGNEHYA